MAKEKKERPEDGKPPVPECMTTFADMITLMLTFFILLCTMSETQNVEYFASGVGSFRRAVESMGLPGIMLSNSDPTTRQFIKDDNERSRNPGSEEFWEEIADRLLEENPEAMRDALLDSLDSGDDVVVPSGVRFSERSSRLPSETAAALDRFLESIDGLDVQVEVLAFGDIDQTELQDNLALAVGRARAVRTQLLQTGKISPERVLFSGLKPPAAEPTMRDQGEEVLLRLRKL